MATLLLALTILSLVVAGIEAGESVTITLLDSAVAKGAGIYIRTYSICLILNYY